MNKNFLRIEPDSPILRIIFHASIRDAYGLPQILILTYQKYSAQRITARMKNLRYDQIISEEKPSQGPGQRSDQGQV